MAKYDYLISKTAEQAETAINNERHDQARDRIEELRYYVEEYDSDELLIEELDLCLDILSESDDGLNGDAKDVFDSILTELKYQFGGGLIGGLSPNDLAAFDDLDISYEDLSSQSFIPDDKLQAAQMNRNFPDEVVRELFQDRFALDIETSELPESLKLLIAFMRIESLAALRNNFDSIRQMAETRSGLQDQLDQAVTSLRETNRDISSALEDSGVDDLRKLRGMDDNDENQDSRHD
jgi:hypothetical protein